MSDDQSPDHEVEQEELEFKALSENWLTLTEFLENFCNMNLSVMSDKVRQLRGEILKGIEAYARRLSGVIPKVKKEDRVKIELNGRQTSEDSTGIDSSDDTDEDKTIRKLVKRLDNRNLPKLGNFDENSGLHLEDYLKRFENYCREMYRGSSDLWIGELEDRLTGRALEGLLTVKQDDEGYKRTKERLLKWYEEERELRVAKARKKFQNASMKNNESIFLYSNRLLSLFKVAYPSKQADKSTNLIYKFQQTVPKAFKSILNNQIVSIRIKDETVLYSQLQKCARIFELNAGREEEDEESGKEEIVINLGQTRDRHTAREGKAYGQHSRQGREGQFGEQDQWNRNWRERPNVTRDQGNSVTRGRYDWKNYQPRNEEVQIQKTPQYNHLERYTNWSNRPPITLHDPCTCCGRYGHSIETCRTFHRLCYKCGGEGHFARDCKINRERKISTPSYPNERRQRPRTMSASQAATTNLNGQPPH